jgi:hypothetical protein
LVIAVLIFQTVKLNKSLTMKKLIFAMLLSSLFIVACTKEEATTTTGDEISVSETPSVILTYISENYPDAEIATVLKSSSGSQYSVILDTYEQINFDKQGNVLNESEEGTLCDSTGGHHGDGGHHGGGHHGGMHHGGGIPVDSLPATIDEYVTEYYPGFDIHNAHYDTLCQFGVVINVMIDSSEVSHHKLIFDASGIYLALAHRVDTLDLPAAVLSSITTNYSGYSPRYRAEMLTLESGDIQYRIFLHQQKEKLIVVMLEDGTVVCEQ